MCRAGCATMFDGRCCERVIGTLRRKLLDRALILNERHLALVLHEYLKAPSRGSRV